MDGRMTHLLECVPTLYRKLQSKVFLKLYKQSHPVSPVTLYPNMAMHSLGGLLFIIIFIEIIHVRAQDECHCRGGCSSPITPCPSGCERGYYDIYCQTQNVALGKKASQISTYSHYLKRIGNLVKKYIPNTPDKAVDGNTNGFYSRRSCTHTGLNETAPYWTVDLGQIYTVYKIIIYQRTTLRERLTGFEVRVDNEVCYRWQSQETPPIRIPLSCQQPIRGRNVTVRLPPRDDRGLQILTLCEVLVLVCDDYWFGERCDRICHCRDAMEKCNSLTGMCNSGCASGYIGDSCQQLCPDGKWGEDCQRTCGACRAGIACIPQTGECVSFGCEPGYEGPACDKKINQNPTGEEPKEIERGSVSVKSDSPDDDGHLSSGDITAIFFGVLIAAFTAAAVVIVYRRWRASKTVSMGDNRYEDLIRRPNTTEHLYVDVSHNPTSGVKVSTDNEAKFTCSDDHYEYVGACDGYLEPVSPPTK